MAERIQVTKEDKTWRECPACEFKLDRKVNKVVLGDKITQSFFICNKCSLELISKLARTI